MTDNNINYLAKLLELKDNMPFCTYKEEARWLLENGVEIPVRCKDCEYLSKNKFYCTFFKIPIIDNGFCHKGKLKEREGK